MVRLLLQFAGDDEPSYAVRITTFARDTIDMYVQTVDKLDPADPELNEKIAQHPLMLQETAKQESDLSALLTVKSPHQMRDFRESATRLQRSNIGLVLGANRPEK